MIVRQRKDCVRIRFGKELLEIGRFGRDSLRVRATENADFSGQDHALTPNGKGNFEVRKTEDTVEIRNGMISCVAEKNGKLSFFRKGEPILCEYYRGGDQTNLHSAAPHFGARQYRRSMDGGENSQITVRFEGNEGEAIYGMGQYQQPELNLKGCLLELAHRNSQISIPFYLSSRKYGFFWNHPGVGEVFFGENYTQWRADSAKEIDYWITAGDSPKEIIENYTDVVGRAPEYPENAMGLWQCKLRYRTQEEVLDVAREYHRRGLPLDVIVIDFFHWTKQGDWKFDSRYFPDPAAMMKELRSMGMRCMVSVWPMVEKDSENYKEMQSLGLCVTPNRGADCLHSATGVTTFFDPTNPETRKYVWNKIRKNYYRSGIDMFWLDEAEPEYSVYDFDNYRYRIGSVSEVGNLYPVYYSRMFYEAMKQAGQTDIVNLVRCAWAGSQKYGAAVWSGDVKSTFASLKDQISAGLNVGLAGIPWWTTDIGGFHGDVTEPGFTELLIRWFQFATYCPILRMHGCRGPRNIPNLPGQTHGRTGQPNELWSYGDEAYRIMERYLRVRESMKPYIADLFREASRNGSPLMRPMFYEFPDDPDCAGIDDQYMFGAKYLVAPVTEAGVRERRVYLPAGKWKNVDSGCVLDGKATVSVDAPLERIPVFERIE